MVSGGKGICLNDGLLSDSGCAARRQILARDSWVCPVVLLSSCPRIKMRKYMYTEVPVISFFFSDRTATMTSLITELLSGNSSMGLSTEANCSLLCTGKYVFFSVTTFSAEVIQIFHTRCSQKHTESDNCRLQVCSLHSGLPLSMPNADKKSGIEPNVDQFRSRHFGSMP